MAMRRYVKTKTEASVERSSKRAIDKEDGVVMWRKNASASIYSGKAFPDRSLYAKFGFAMLVELKRSGEVADDDQAKLHGALIDAGHIVYCLDNALDVVWAYRKEYLRWLQSQGQSREFVRLLKKWCVRTPRPKGRVQVEHVVVNRYSAKQLASIKCLRSIMD